MSLSISSMEKYDKKGLKLEEMEKVLFVFIGKFSLKYGLNWCHVYMECYDMRSFVGIPIMIDWKNINIQLMNVVGIELKDIGITWQLSIYLCVLVESRKYFDSIVIIVIIDSNM